MAMMSREQMITACVDDQIERKIIPAESREKQIKWRLNGGCGMRKMDGWNAMIGMLQFLRRILNYDG